jgi:hypothetical protein
MSGMIGGQQAMFGNFASYAQQISPGYGGPPPTYNNPMSGAGMATQPPPPPTWESMDSHMGMQMGPRAISAIGNVGLPVAAGATMMAGSFLPGAAGRFFGGLDPLTAGFRGASSAIGGFGTSNLARIGAGGIGSIARAGLAGIGGAAARAVPILAVAQAAKYGIGQMVQGAQFQNQVHNQLQQDFRFVNPQAQTGFGFTREQTSGIASMVREMGHSDMMTGPQELLRVMKQGTQMGVFRAVQDAREFKKRFKEMVGALKEVSKTMNTTLEGAIPFFQQSRQMGFWTPQDIQRVAPQVQSTAQTTGMSVAQVQSMMGQGAQMARSVGALGAHGAMGMTRALGLVGGGLRAGAISEQQLAEATGGLQGPQAIQAMAGTLQAATTRFAAGRQARWLLASMGRNGFKGLDAGQLGLMQSGMVSLGQIGSGARRNIGRQGAFNFVMNERDLRGELLRQGPGAQLGFVRSLVGSRIYGTGAKDKYITRRLMRRYFGVSGRQADMLANLAREAPRIMEQNMSRTSNMMDAQARQRDEVMNRSWEGFKRRASEWWDKNVKDPLQQAGASMSKNIGDWWERQTDAFWGRSARGQRFRGFSGRMMKAWQMQELGDTGAMNQAFATPGQAMAALSTTGGGTFGGQLSLTKGQGGLLGAGSNLFAAAASTGVGRALMAPAFGGLPMELGAAATGIGNLFGGGERTNESIEAMRRLGVGEYAFKTEAERRAAVESGGYVSGAIRGGPGAGAYRAFAKKDVTRTQRGLAAAGGTLTRETAEAIGFKSEQQARDSLKAASEEMKSGEFKRYRAMIKLGSDSDISPMALARKQVQAIREGRMGGDKLRQLVEGVSDQQAAFRLAAAQQMTGGKTYGEVDFNEEAKKLGLAGVSDFQTIEKKLSDEMGEQTYKMAWSLSGQSRAGTLGKIGLEQVKESIQKSTMDIFKVPGAGDKLKEALSMMDSGKPEDYAKAKAMIGSIAADYGDELSDQQKAILVQMGDPNRKDMDRALQGMGRVARLQAHYAGKEQIARRMQRFQAAMTGNQEQILSAANRIQKRTGGGALKIGEQIRELMTTSDPRRHGDLLRQIARSAAEADPQDAMRMAAALKGVQGGESVQVALSAGAEVSSLVQSLQKGGKIGGREAMGASNILLGLGAKTGVSAADLRAFRGGKPKDVERVQNKILGDLEGKQREAVKATLDMLKDPGKNISALMEMGIKGATMRAKGQYGPPEKSILAAKAGQIVGRRGSAEGMHIELSRQTAILQSIADKMKAEKTVGNDTGGQGPNDKKAEGK